METSTRSYMEELEIERPYMIEINQLDAWHSGFCYALLHSESEQNKTPELLFTVISGSDSSIQAIKAGVEIGRTLNFGYGEKGESEFVFTEELSVKSDKGKYMKYPITLNNNRKGIIFLHEKLLNSEYVICFGDPADELLKHLGGPSYGLPLLPEWKNVILDELLKRNAIKELVFYKDDNLFETGFTIFKLLIQEEEADAFLKDLIQTNKISFPSKGSGQSLKSIEDLTGYMVQYGDLLFEKVSNMIEPIHDPNKDTPLQLDLGRDLFPMQAHVSTAMSKYMKQNRNGIIQGEMSTGKTSMMVATAQALFRFKKGYNACVMVPPSLTKKWPEEIKAILPEAEVFVIQSSDQLIRLHQSWLRGGKHKPVKPTFFVLSFNTIKAGAAIKPAVKYKRGKILCPDCQKPLQVVESSVTNLNELGEEVLVQTTRDMDYEEFRPNSRRTENNKHPANAFCTSCQTSLWTKKVVNRYSSFKEYAEFENKLVAAISNKDTAEINYLKKSEPPIIKKVGFPRKVAAIDYIKRKMNNFFDIAIVDEIHELKAGNSAQGNALGALSSSCKHVIGGTGTLFGGKAEDIYYTLWRLFPKMMVEAGYSYNESRKWNHEYGNIETTIKYMEQPDGSQYSNKQSHGGVESRTEKVVPGISPFVFSQYLIQSTSLVRLIEVWKDPVNFVDVPTIMVDMDESLAIENQNIISGFERIIEQEENGYKYYLPLLQTGISYLDNPFSYPMVTYTDSDGFKRNAWEPTEQFDPADLLNKEKELIKIVKNEMSEKRKSIIYVRDTGSSREGRDIRPRLMKILTDVGAKVAILDSTIKPPLRSDWLKHKILDQDYDVVIVSQELVKVGLDLLSTPTLIFYQFSWSLFTVNQAARRSWRIGQDKECRLFYLSYKDSYQEYMANIIARKNKAAGAINGEVSNEGLSAMLGDDGDLQSLLIESIKQKDQDIKNDHLAISSRAGDLLKQIADQPIDPPIMQLDKWIKANIKDEAAINVLANALTSIYKHILDGNVNGFSISNNRLIVEINEQDPHIVKHLMKSIKEERERETTHEIGIVPVSTPKKKVVSGQLQFELF